MIEVTAVDHVNLTVSDLPRAVDFYTRVFDFRVGEDHRDDDQPWAIVGRPGVAWVALHERPGRVPPMRNQRAINHWGFVVKDMDDIRARLEEADVPVRNVDNGNGGFFDYPRSRSLYIEDPDGHEIELTSAFGGGL